ncbi:uncharacterized protein LOC112203486 [Rosa chinensis]|uniref:uncharacterized protein LOC112203486 n=1 Tax=Rosa chinensis TaxID=74649 RepID=UPI001AD8A67A|nr:uncharacterized protein LOC112203486 [Rosa chinensis]
MIDEGTSESRPSHGELDVAMLGGTISLTLMKKLLVLFPLNMRNQLSEKDDVTYFVLDSVMTEIFLHLSKWICPPGVMLEKFLEFLENALLGKICSDRRSGKAIQEKHIISLLPFVPKLVSQVANDWKSGLLQAFTKAFKDCNPVSSLKLACLSTMEEMVVPRQGMLYLDPRDPEILNFQIAWIRELPMLLILLGDKNTSHSQVVLHLLLRLGQCAFMNYSFALEYDNMQFSLQEFFCIYQDDGNIIYGPFVRLPRESQELSLCCLRYISNLDLHMLRSIAYCCLCPELEQYVIIRVIEILHSAYKSGHIQIADHISFFITLLSRFRVLPENVNAVMERDVNISNRGTFKSITGIVCSCLLQMGDSSLVFKILEKMVLDQMLQNLPLDNVCAMLRMLIALDSEETIISEQAFVSLVKILPRYLIDIVHCIAEDDGKASGSLSSSACCYYLVPCFFLFVKSHRLLGLVSKMLGSWINESLSILPCDHTHYETDISSRVEAIVSVLLLLHKDDKIWQIMSSFKAEIDCILQSIVSIQSSEEISVTLQEKHKLKCAHDRLENATSALHAEMQFRRNLVSLSQLDSKGCRVSSAGGAMKISRGCMVLMKGEKCGSMFRLIGKTQTSKVEGKRCARGCRYLKRVSFASIAETPVTSFQVSDDGERVNPAREGVKSRSLFRANRDSASESRHKLEAVSDSAGAAALHPRLVAVPRLPHAIIEPKNQPHTASWERPLTMSPSI